MAPPALSLKQRLAALTTNTPASPISPISRSSGFPSPRSSNNGFGLLEMEEQYEGMRAEDREMIDKALNAVITQAGVDYETRPMVVVTAASFPDPRLVSYDILLSRIIAYLDLYVENDYVVVFLAAGGRHTPSWNWVWKAYRSMSRKYRKNLKRLLIVHPTWFSKMFVSLGGAVLSPKFFRKITYVSTLSELARYVPLTQIEIAPAVYKYVIHSRSFLRSTLHSTNLILRSENLKHERNISLPSSVPASLTFGVPLEQLMGPDGESSPVPRVIRDCVEYLRSEGPLGLNLEVEGLFRRSPNVGLLRSVREAYDRGNQVTLAQYYDPHIAAVLIKKFLRDLPEPIFSGALYPVIAKCPPSTGWGVDGLSGPPPSKLPSSGTSSPGLSNGTTNGVNGRGHKRVGSEAEMATVGGWGEGDACVEYIREVLLPAMGWGCRVVLLGYVFHLLHDVSLRSSVNKMDAHNLALCISPNLVRSNDPIRDVKMCAVPGAASMTSGTWNTPGARPAAAAPPRKAGSTTLGDIVRVCIERYFEIFEDVPDRADALPVPSELKFDDETGTLVGSSLMGSAILVDGSPTQPSSGDTSLTSLDSIPRSSVDIEDDELNEAMLVMSVTPEPPAPRSPRSMRAGVNLMSKSTGTLGPSSWSRSPKLSSAPVSPRLPNVSTSALGLSPAKPTVPLGSPAHRHRRTPSSNSTALSVAHTTGQNSTSGPGSTIRGARSVISIDKQVGSRKGSIALGRSGSSGASGVAALGVTATGFFERPA
ncbi:Rho GTPase-activating protein 1 OS=Homo sapiens GN=ARHGAP1 PE=1 SV=1 [Rhizoctonia solani AG-1 IB]|uniref:Rho GTPase-activating protein 1 n=1 Tax=Thanatephorus cucumeris (strain AG1-IB / isolate 7/3/14) TaxID=1108050 RepID=A0A0B7FRT9_THACB|nr:Rho GTPase-activating protein 1 OS=Homo sapiens GN=ARHGAP1 PE=1 SV=1 [Rhizoctonia solani AG-1 IB]